MSTVNPIGGTYENIQTDYSINTGVDKLDGETASNSEFAQLISKAVNDLTAGSLSNLSAGMNTSAGLSGMTGMPGSFMPNSMLGGLPMASMNNTLEQAIMTATSSGSSDDAMVALLMLMMMLQSQSGEGSGDMTMMMQMMASMISQMQEKEKKALRDDLLYSSGGTPFALDTIDEQVFGNPLTEQEATGLEVAELPLQWWRPATPVLKSTEANRSPRMYNNVIAQFNVDSAERYRPGREGNTYCNVYVWDVTRAMGAELPYYSDPETGAPREYPDTKGASYNGARAMDRWLKNNGGKFGWFQVSAYDAQMHANQGRPVVASGGDIGHISMVAPSRDGSFDNIRGVTIAQAGRQVSSYMYISEVYGAEALANKITYWVHY